MERKTGFLFFIAILLFAPAFANSRAYITTDVSRAGTTKPTSVTDFVSPTNFETMYPYMNNTMKVKMNPGVTTEYSSLPTSVTARTENLTTRRVVPRTGTTNSNTTAARSATTSTTYNTSTTNVSRSATTPATRTTSSTSNSNRRVVARSSVPTNNVQTNVYSTYVSGGTDYVSAERCLADYTDCMNDYCEREDTAYNRCYCSSKLAQIDDQYRTEIDELIMEILTLKNGAIVDESELNAYWNDMIGVHTNDNSWENLDNLLDIDWTDSVSTVRGQESFIMGHDYCIQHLTACGYMSGNMRDMYKSEIARDCNEYEYGLNGLKNAAKDFVEALK